MYLKGRWGGDFIKFFIRATNIWTHPQEKHSFKTQNLLYFYVRTPEWLRLFCLSSQWKGEIQEFCPNTKMLLVGCKSDLRTDLSTLVELSNHRQAPVSYDQVCRLKEHFEMVDGSNFIDSNQVIAMFNWPLWKCANPFVIDASSLQKTESQ